MTLCDCCGKPPRDKKTPGQFWTLNNYFGISGCYCANCYELISHDAFGRPKHPEEYTMFLLKQESKNGKAKT